MPANATATRRPALADAPVRDVLAGLRVDSTTGLSEDEARKRIAVYGYNEVPEERQHPLVAFLRKFWGLSAWMLELIILLSLALHKYADVAVVAALLLLNAIVSVRQERRAAGVVAALRRRLLINARVLRGGTWQLKPARELVPGDIVRVRAGDVVPADLKALSGTMSVDRSALTGESVDVPRAAGDMLASGSLVRRGEGTGVVLATGVHTYFGRTTELVQQARPALHIEAVVAKVVRWLFAIVFCLMAIVAVLSVARSAPLVDAAPLLLVLLMSAIPVALPVMFTVTMSVGADELARRGVLVTRLSAAEDAATMDTLCVDKTGTLTRNALVVSGVSPQPGATESDVLRAAALASQEANQDPIDVAVLAAARQHGLLDAAATTPIAFQPFDPATRRTEAIVAQGTQRLRMVKGSVHAVAAYCEVDAATLAALDAQATNSATKGYRTLAVARGPESGRAQLIGLLSLYDPPRPDARGLIDAVRALGVRVIMLTGDALPVAREIGAELGLGSIRLAKDLAISPDAWANSDGYAEVYPEDKYTLVRRLQQRGHSVGMTGDGVNDAPALRQAEVGIAVAGATDVARGAASVVLTEPGLTNIVALVQHGRSIFQRVLTWIFNKISRTMLKATYVAIAFVFTGKFVISAFGMLLLVFMTDFAKISLATDRVRWSQEPESWNIGSYAAVAAVLGLLMIAETLGFLAIVWQRFGFATSDARLSTFSFQLLLFFAAFSILSARERRWFGASAPGRALIAALATEVVAGVALTVMGIPDLPRLPWRETIVMFGYAAVSCLVVNDAAKSALLRRYVLRKTATFTTA